MQSQPVVLIIGQGEPMEGSLTEALEQRGLEITRCATPDVHTHVEQIAPDMLLLIGDAAVRNGSALIRTLTLDADTSILPVILLSNEATLRPEASTFRSGPVAVLARGLGAEALADQIAELAVEVPQRSGLSTGDVDEKGLQALVDLVSEELKAGILSVGSEAPGVGTVSVVVDTERPPATNIEEALSQLRAMLPPTEPLHYEFYEAAGGRVSLLSAEQQSATTDLEYLQGVRIALMDGDSSRTRALLQALASRGAQAVIVEPHVAALSGIRDVDPQVAIFGSSSIQGDGFEVVRKMRQDPQFQWTSLLVVRWDEIWPEGAYTPDLAKLANRIAALTKQDAALQRRAEDEVRFDTRLESLGPGRMLRALAGVPGSRHITVAGSAHTVEVDVADGVVLGAYVTSEDGEPEQGVRALSGLWKLRSGRVTVWEQDVPSIANVLMPVDEALGLAARELEEVGESADRAPHAPTHDGLPTIAPPHRQSQGVAQADLSIEDVGDGIERSIRHEEPITLHFSDDSDYETAAATARALPQVYPPIETGDETTPRFESSIRMRVDDEVPTAKVKRPQGTLLPDPALAAPRPVQATPLNEVPSQRPVLWFSLLLLTGAVAMFVQWVGQDGASGVSAALSTSPPAATTPVRVEPVEVTKPKANHPPTEIADAPTDPALATALANLPPNPQKASDVLVWRSIPKIRQGDLAVAEALLEQAWALDNKNPQAMAAFAQLHIAKNNPSQALVWAEIAVRKRPRRAQYHLVHGDALALNGDMSAAKKAWRKALRYDRDNRSAKRRLRNAK